MGFRKLKIGGLGLPSVTASHITRLSTTKSADVALATSDRRFESIRFPVIVSVKQSDPVAFASRKPTFVQPIDRHSLGLR